MKYANLIVISMLLLLSCSINKHAGAADNKKDKIKTLLKNINKNPDKLHADYTPAVHELIKLGDKALNGGVLELLLSKDKYTRLHAQRVLEGIILVKHGFVFGQGWKTSDGEKRVKTLWKANGTYNSNGTEKLRNESVKKWKIWVAQHVNNKKKPKPKSQPLNTE